MTYDDENLHLMALLVMQDVFGNVPTWPLCKMRSHVM